jgi:hypothetical protein
MLFEAPGERELDLNDSSSLFSADSKQGIFKVGNSVELAFTVYDFPCGSAEEMLDLW